MKIYKEITQSEWRLRNGSTGNTSSTRSFWNDSDALTFYSNESQQWLTSNPFQQRVILFQAASLLPCSQQAEVTVCADRMGCSELLPLLISHISHWECSQTTPRPLCAPRTGRLKSGGSTGAILDKCGKETEGIKVKRRQQHSFAENSFPWHMTNMYFKCK